MSTSSKITVFHFLLLATAILTISDCIYLLFSFLESFKNHKRYLNQLSLPIWNGNKPLILAVLIIIRLVSAFLVLAFGYWYGARYQRRVHLIGHSIYFSLISILLFQIGLVLNYQENVWSLVLQIIHLYVSLIYTFKAFLYHYDDHLDSRMDFGRRTADIERKNNQTTTWSLDKAIQRSRYGKTLYFINKNLLAISTLIMIILSILVSVLLRQTISNKWSPRRLMRLTFVGEIFIRVLLSLIVPLIGTSIAYACTGFDSQFSGRLMSEITTYYLVTTALATLEGLIMVSVIAPGHRTTHISKGIPVSKRTGEQPAPIMIEDTILDMIRNIFTDSLFGSWINTYHTKLTPPSEGKNMSNIENWKIDSEQIRRANIMSVVALGLLIGLSANIIRTRGVRIIVDLIEATNTIMMMVTLAIVQAAPVCTVFLIVPQILTVDDLGDMFCLVGWFTMTVLLSLALHCLVILSAIYLIFTRKNPYRFLSDMFPAISTAFATSSSSASMSVTMKCLEESVQVPAFIVRFVVPFGSTVNTDGAALYESVAAIFVAQYRGLELNMGQLITIAMTSILVSVGAAGIPQAGMITTIVVLNSIGLSLEDAGLVMVVDFMLDRFRTIVNVLGDAFGATVVAVRLKHMFKNYEQGKSLTTNSNEQPQQGEFEEVIISSSLPSSKISMIKTIPFESTKKEKNRNSQTTSMTNQELFLINDINKEKVRIISSDSSSSQ